jgi:Arc/MetJ-type ribon-helix-helix transcriptional regulator
MPKARLVQLRVPDELLRRIDRFVAQGLYRSRSEVMLDATRRFLERTAPIGPLELFIDSYLTGRLKSSSASTKKLEVIFEKVRSDPSWRVRFGSTPEEIMRKLRSRAG